MRLTRDINPDLASNGLSKKSMLTTSLPSKTRKPSALPRDLSVKSYQQIWQKGV
ncbi:MAG: hypothetical protein U0401_01420 [Anaerolineae bacterium]